MAVERTLVEGYGPANAAPHLAPYPRDRQLSDSIPTPNNGPQHEQHHGPPSGREVHHHQHPHHRSGPPEIDREAFSMLREQVSYNYQCIQQDREAITRFDQHIGQFQSTVMRMLEDFRHELATRVGPASNQAAQSQSRPDHGDIDVLANQIAAVTSKANEIDNLKVQLELMKTKVRRLEQENLSLQPARPASAASHREQETAQPQQQHYGTHGHHNLPPIKTGASTSPTHHRGPPNGYHGQPEQQYYREQRPSSGEQQAQPSQRSAEPVPPGWRSAVPPTSQPTNGSVRTSQHEGDSRGGAWAPVNPAQGKRSYEDGPPRDHSAPTSPKRPKLAPLAPLKPRNGVSEDPHASYPQQPPSEHYINTRLPLHERPPPPPQVLTTPASATGPAPPNAYKFIATTPHDAPEHWRDGENGLTPTSARGGRGRGRGRTIRGRGGRDSIGSGQEHDAPEWEQKPPDSWHTHNAPSQQQHQLSPNGYYGTYRPLPPRNGESAQHEYPLTPIASAVSPSDQSMLAADGSSGNKKTRTKPIRNADGVLIRKDGRPDMRSVSSANNLRKVHAKKEAERAESDGRTPISARELAPAHSFNASDDEGEVDGSTSAGQGDDESRDATPKTQTDGEKDGVDGEMRREGSISSSEHDKKLAGRRWISSKYEREGELQEKRKALENGMSDEPAVAQKSPQIVGREDDVRPVESAAVAA